MPVTTDEPTELHPLQEAEPLVPPRRRAYAMAENGFCDFLIPSSLRDGGKAESGSGQHSAPPRCHGEESARVFQSLSPDADPLERLVRHFTWSSAGMAWGSCWP